MDMKQLTALVTVSEVGSISKAAQVLQLAQPSITRRIRTLEEELGVPLFERTRYGVTPTEAGQILVKRARRALVELERARAEIRPHGDGVVGMVSIGLLESVADALVEPLVRAISERHPGIELRLLTAYSGHLQEWLDEGIVDLSLLYNLAPSPSLWVVPLLDEELWAVAPPGSGLSPRDSVPCAKVFARPMILPVPGHGLRVLIDHAVSTVGLDPKVQVQVNSMALQKSMVLAQQAWSILPAAGVASEIEAGRLSGAPLSEPVVKRSVVLGLPRGVRLAPAVEAVTVELRRVIHRLVSSGQWVGATLAEPNEVEGKALRSEPSL